VGSLSGDAKTFRLRSARRELTDEERRNELFGWLSAGHAEKRVVTTTLLNRTKQPGLRWLMSVSGEPISPPVGFGVDQIADLQRVEVAPTALLFGLRRLPEEDTSSLRDGVLAELATATFRLDIVAQPRDPVHVHRLTRDLEQVFDNVANNKLRDSLAGRFGAELFAERHRDLVDAVAHGGWELTAEVIAADADLYRVMGLIGVLLSDGGLSCRSSVGAEPTASTGGDLHRWYEATNSQTISSQQLSSLIRAPGSEVPGYALAPNMPFDLNPEERTSSSGRALRMGQVMDRSLRPTIDFDLPIESVNRHMLLCGATGSGKTQSTKRVLLELHEQGIPWLVIEPAKHEYREIAAQTDATVIRIGDLDTPAMGLNILEPQSITRPGRGLDRFPLETHIDMVNALFELSFEAQQPFPQILATALRTVYSDQGWSIPLGTYKGARFGEVKNRSQSYARYPNLTSLRQAAIDAVKDVGYDGETLRNMTGYIDVRIGSLCSGTPSNFFDHSHPIDMERLLERNVIIEVEDVGNDRDKSFVIGALILRLYELLRLLGPSTDGSLRHVVVVEEAHRLLRAPAEGAEGGGGQSVELFSSMLAEVRAFGEGVVVVEQIPTKLISDVVKNTAIQVVHRLPSLQDRQVVGGAMNMSQEQSDYLVSTNPGTAAVFREGMDQPVLVAIDGVDPDHGATLQAEAATNISQTKPGALHAATSAGPVCIGTCPSDPHDRRLSVELALIAEKHPELTIFLEITVEMVLAGFTPCGTNQPWVARLGSEVPSAAALEALLVTLVTPIIERRWDAIADFWNPEEVIRTVRDFAINVVRGLKYSDLPTYPTGRFYGTDLRDGRTEGKDIAGNFGKAIADASQASQSGAVVLQTSEYVRFEHQSRRDGSRLAKLCDQWQPGHLSELHADEHALEIATAQLVTASAELIYGAAANEHLMWAVKEMEYTQKRSASNA